MPISFNNEDYVIPTLSEDGQLAYHPDVFMAEYGMYLDQYDPSEELIDTAQHNILQADTLLTGYDELRKVNKKLGAQGINNAYSDSLQGNMLDTIGTKLQLSNLTNLANTDKLRRKHRAGIYDELSYLGTIGAYDEEYSPGMQAMTENDVALYEMQQWLDDDAAESAAYQDYGNPCPCPDGGFSVSCCEDTESDNLSTLYGFDEGNVDYGLSMYEYEWWGTDSPGHDMWMQGVIDNFANYDSCLEGATSVTEQEFCYDNLIISGGENDNIAYGMNICDTEGLNYDEEACQAWTTGG